LYVIDIDGFEMKRKNISEKREKERKNYKGKTGKICRWLLLLLALYVYSEERAKKPKMSFGGTFYTEHLSKNVQ
jgi:hypothetical protein